MKKEKIKKMMDEMYKSLTDPEEIAKARRLTERKKRIEDKKLDTGI